MGKCDKKQLEISYNVDIDNFWETWYDLAVNGNVNDNLTKDTNSIEIIKNFMCNITDA